LCRQPLICTYLQVNEVRGLLGALTEEMPSFLSDTTICRFLLARNWSTEQLGTGARNKRPRVSRKLSSGGASTGRKQFPGSVRLSCKLAALLWT
jgi:hypothetical protein